MIETTLSLFSLYRALGGPDKILQNVESCLSRKISPKQKQQPKLKKLNSKTKISKILRCEKRSKNLSNITNTIKLYPKDYNEYSVIAGLICLSLVCKTRHHGLENNLIKVTNIKTLMRIVTYDKNTNVVVRKFATLCLAYSFMSMRTCDIWARENELLFRIFKFFCDTVIDVEKKINIQSSKERILKEGYGSENR